MAEDMAEVRFQVWRVGKNRLKPAKQWKKRLKVESQVASDHTSTLKSELGYLKLESLQALCNRGFEVEETLVFYGMYVNLLYKKLNLNIYKVYW